MESRKRRVLRNSFEVLNSNEANPMHRVAGLLRDWIAWEFVVALCTMVACCCLYARMDLKKKIGLVSEDEVDALIGWLMG